MYTYVFLSIHTYLSGYLRIYQYNYVFVRILTYLSGFRERRKFIMVAVLDVPVSPTTIHGRLIWGKRTNVVGLVGRVDYFVGNKPWYPGPFCSGRALDLKTVGCGLKLFFSSHT